MRTGPGGSGRDRREYLCLSGHEAIYKQFLSRVTRTRLKGNLLPNAGHSIKPVVLGLRGDQNREKSCEYSLSWRGKGRWR